MANYIKTRSALSARIEGRKGKKAVRRAEGGSVPNVEFGSLASPEGYALAQLEAKRQGIERYNQDARVPYPPKLDGTDRADFLRSEHDTRPWDEYRERGWILPAARNPYTGQHLSEIGNTGLAYPSPVKAVLDQYEAGKTARQRLVEALATESEPTTKQGDAGPIARVAHDLLIDAPVKAATSIPRMMSGETPIFDVDLETGRLLPSQRAIGESTNLAGNLMIGGGLITKPEGSAGVFAGRTAKAEPAAATRTLDPLGYYSKLDEVLSSFRPTDTVTAQTLAQRGVKASELQARGLDMFDGDLGQRFTQWAKNNGYDGFRFAEESPSGAVEGVTTAMLEPRNIRSVNAAFDPAKKDSPLLLAANSSDNPVLPGVVVGNERKGFTGWHGSPHLFEPEPGYPLGRFRPDKIGTGEGAQAYGYGHYVAGNEGVAKWYRDGLAPGFTPAFNGVPFAQLPEAERSVARWIMNTGAHPNEIAKIAEARAAQAAKDPIAVELGLQDAMAAPHRDLANAARRIAEGGKWDISQKPNGHMYEVNVNAEPSRFLDWDKPLIGQSDSVREGLAKALERRGGSIDKSGSFGSSGAGLHNLVSAWSKHDQKAVSEAMRDAGIAGIRYLDQGSRKLSANLDGKPIPHDNWAANLAGETLELHGTPQAAIESLKRQVAGKGFTAKAAEEAIELLSSGRVAPTAGTQNTVIFPGNEHLTTITRRYANGGLTH